MRIELDSKRIKVEGKLGIKVFDDNNVIVPDVSLEIMFNKLVNTTEYKSKDKIEEVDKYDNVDGDIIYDGYEYLKFIGTYRIKATDNSNARVSYATFETYTSKENLDDVLARFQWNFSKENIDPLVSMQTYNAFINNMGEDAIIQAKETKLERTADQIKNDAISFMLPDNFNIERAVFATDDNGRVRTSLDKRNAFSYSASHSRMNEYQMSYYIDKPNNALFINGASTDSSNQIKIVMDYYRKPYVINTKINLLLSDIEFPFENEGIALFEYYFAWRYNMRIEELSTAKYYQGLYESAKYNFIQSINSEAENRMLANRKTRPWS